MSKCERYLRGMSDRVKCWAPVDLEKFSVAQVQGGGRVFSDGWPGSLAK